MVKRSIGIEIGTDYLCAVQIAQFAEHLQLEKIVRRQTRRASDFVSTELKDLLNQEGFDQHAPVAASLPANTVFFRTIQTDGKQIEQLPNLDTSLTQYQFPIEPEDVVAQVCSYRRQTDDNYSVLMAGTSENTLNKTLNDFAKAHMEPQLIDAPAFGIYSTVALNHPDIRMGQAVIVHVDKSYLIVIAVSENDIKVVRNIPLSLISENNIDSVQQEKMELLLRQIKVTCRKAFGTINQDDIDLYLTNDRSYTAELKWQMEDNLHSQVTIVNPLAEIQTSEDCKDKQNMHVAEGLACRQLSQEANSGVNFLQTKDLKNKKTVKFKKDLAICAVLIAAIGIIAVIGLLVKKAALESQYAKMTNEAKQIFRETLPEEGKLVAPLTQLNQKLKSLRKNYLPLADVGINLSPVKVLHTITTSIPTGTQMNINDMLITSDSVRITGTTDSFESIYIWQDILQKMPEFSKVKVEDNNLDPEGELVYFTISASPTTQE